MGFLQDFVHLDKTIHNLKNFDCGKQEMNMFLARFAAKHMTMGLSTTWVLPCIDTSEEKEEKHKIAAYYTLALTSVKREEIPATKSLPRYPVPTALLARLAVDKEFQNMGLRLGEKTLITALRKAVELTENGLPFFGLILDVLDEDALGFYQHYDMFEPFTDDPMRLFVSMEVLKQI